MKYLVIVLLLIILIVSSLKKKNYVFASKYELNHVVYLRQNDDISCGPVTATMFLQWYGVKCSVDEVTQKMYTKWFSYQGKTIGMTAPDVLTYGLNKYKVNAVKVQGNDELLKQVVSGGKPVIVLVRSGASTWHYLMVIGYNDKVVIAADPSSGRREIEWKKFLSAWEFKTDLYGIKCGMQCPFCNNGCPFCNDGYVDPMLILLKNAEVKERTMIY